MAQHGDLIAEIEVRGGLVHDEEIGLLCERACNERELPFAAADFGAGGILQMRNGKGLKRLFRNFDIQPGRRSGKALPACTPHRHHIQQAIGKWRRVSLGNIGDTRSELPGGIARNILAIEQNTARLRLDEAQEGFEQGRLARAVRAEQEEKVPALDRKRQILEHGSRSMTASEVFCSQFGHRGYSLSAKLSWCSQGGRERTVRRSAR